MKESDLAALITKAASRSQTCSLPLISVSTRCGLSSFVPIDAAVKDMQNAVGVRGDIWLVGDQDNGVSLAVKLIEEAHYLLRSLGVEVSGRLVGQQYRRIIHESSRDCHALALTTRQLVRLV